MIVVCVLVCVYVCGCACLGCVCAFLCVCMLESEGKIFLAFVKLRKNKFMQSLHPAGIFLL